MEFIKRHYEKLLLASLLLLFIGAMLYLLWSLQEIGQLSQEDLKLPTRAADVVPVKADDEIFNIDKKLFDSKTWEKSTPRNPMYANYSSDLMIAFAAARCGHCERIIPFYYFDGTRKCPWPQCGQELAKPPVDESAFIPGPRTPQDPDGCGIPHEEKSQLGLSLDDPGNVMDDADGDGFSNVYEFKFYRNDVSGENVNYMINPKIHPPMWHRLAMTDAGNVELPCILRAIKTNDTDDKSRWDIEVEQLDKKRTTLLSLGSSIELDGQYCDVKEIKLAKDAAQSSIVLGTEDGKTIEMFMNKAPRSLGVKASLTDVSTGKIYIVGENADFSIGDRRSGTVRYKVKSIDAVTKQVYLVENTRKGAVEIEEPISRDSKIPVRERIRKRPANRMGLEMGMM